MIEDKDKEIENIRTEFGRFKKEVSDRLDELFEELQKPIFTDKQIMGMVIGVVVYLVIAVSYVNKTDARSIENYNNIIYANQKNDKMMDLLLDIKATVDKNEGRIQNQNSND